MSVSLDSTESSKRVGPRLRKFPLIFARMADWQPVVGSAERRALYREFKKKRTHFFARHYYVRMGI